MQFRNNNTHLHDVIIISGESFSDERGLFMETFNSHEVNIRHSTHPRLKEQVTIFPQDNVSYSSPGVLRGLHIQRNNPQGKLVRCLKGRILDVIVDLRPDSPSFKKWGAFELNTESKKMLWVPPGYAHGFYSYDESIVYYKCSTLYDKESDGGINPFDPELNIKWPSKSPIMSGKDKNLPSLSEWLSKD